MRTAARIKNLLLILLVFVLAGPPIGTLAFIVAVALIESLSRPERLVDFAMTAPLLIAFGLYYGYLIGTLPAAVAGLLIGSWQSFVGPVPWWLAVGAGSIVGNVLMVVVKPPQPPLGIANSIVVLICMAATVGSWLIVRPWHIMRKVRGTS